MPRQFRVAVIGRTGRGNYGHGLAGFDQGCRVAADQLLVVTALGRGVVVDAVLDHAVDVGDADRPRVAALDGVARFGLGRGHPTVLGQRVGVRALVVRAAAAFG